VTVLDPLSFSGACILSHTRVGQAVVFASAAVAAMLSEQIRHVINSTKILILHSFPETL
jgi:hypothetical protein